MWSVPTAEDLATCDSIWVSGSIEFDKPLEDSAEYLSKRKEWVQLVPEPFKTTFPDNNFPQQCAFICVDARSYIRKPLAYGRRCKTLPCSLYSFGVFFIFLFIFVILLMLGMQVFELLSFFSSRLLNLGALIYIPRIDDLSCL